MSEYGLIKDTTMTALADGFREKGIIPSTRDVVIATERYKTEYVTSDTDPTPTKQPDMNGDNFNINIPGATYLKFVFNIGKVVSKSDTTRLGFIRFYKDGFKMIELEIYPTTEDVLTYVLDPAYGSEVRVDIDNSGYGSSHTFATIFDVYGVETITNEVLPEEMVEAINECPQLPPEEAFLLTGSLIYKFSNRHWDWFINQYKDRITTKDIDNLMNAFNAGNVGDDANIPDIPFVLNVKDITSMSGAFDNQSKLRNIPVIRGTIKWGTNTDLRGFSSLYNVRDFENLFTDEMLQGFSTVKVTSAYSTPKPVNFNCARSLRSLPSWFYLFRLNEESTTWPSNTYQIYYMLFSQCCVLDEALNIPVWKCKAALTSNVFSSTFDSCYRLKDFTFETINGQPVVANWKSQTINMSGELGYSNGGAYYVGVILNYNSGITADKEVKDDETYQALKDDPDYFATKMEYSRYNHDAAVRTINSLPDTSAYLASAGGTNTIKFRGNAGSKTDGGAINTLTAEEIAVAAAKGWTVSIV